MALFHRLSGRCALAAPRLLAAPARPSTFTLRVARLCTKPPAPTAESGGFFRNAMAAYEGALEARPLLTKSVTSGLLYGVGDTIAQNVAQRQAPEAECTGFDLTRVLRAVAYGGLFYPILAHFHYNFLEWLVVTRWATSTAWIPFSKMFLEQFVYWSYFTTAYYHCVLGALQGFSPQQCYDRVAETMWPTLKAQWAFWIPAQLINFRFVPLRHQLNFVLVVSLAWTTFLSLAFPPKKRDEKH